MSYCLKKDEPLAPGLRRIAREQLAKALGEMNGFSPEDEGAAVLATRKQIKRTRALLRLVRRQLGPAIFKGENQRLRDVARNFSGSRDADVQLQVLEKLRDGAGLEPDSFPKTAGVLESEKRKVAESFGREKNPAAASLQQVCDRLEGWPLENLASDDFACALKRTYRRGRNYLRAVESEPSAENFHTWRKRVKDLCYQAQILQQLNPTILCEIAGGAKILARHLGDLHDFAFFRERLETGANFPENERSLLLGLICSREQELERVTLDQGARLYAEKPGDFGRRLLLAARQRAARRGPT
ncbi:MAG: CHAD domain-containing protein [Chthoniobacterales bacterium]